ncbi:hypothetical protein [Streptomyces katrae]|uniref:hypothetical protein n=1 Tax=Streptomyces katrae TaxID=68223 RepID=UPI001F362321|nr:hypothetical protein [Streptomyces katrae]
MNSARKRHGPAAGRAADRHARAAATRWRHDGLEAQWARSDLRLRRLLSAVFAPVFAAGGALFVFLASESSDHTPSAGTLCAVLAAFCFLLAAVALADLYVIRRRTREQQRWRREP